MKAAIVLLLIGVSAFLMQKPVANYHGYCTNSGYLFYQWSRVTPEEYINFLNRSSQSPGEIEYRLPKAGEITGDNHAGRTDWERMMGRQYFLVWRIDKSAEFSITKGKDLVFVPNCIGK